MGAGRVRISKLRFLYLLLSGFLLLIVLLGVDSLIAQREQGSGTSASNNSSQLFLPLIAESTPPLLCRFGVNVVFPLSELNVTPLRMGWYADYGSRIDPYRPKGSTYVHTIRLSQIGANDYATSVDLNLLPDIIANNLGSDWLIGNEPDRRIYQDDLLPHVYAKAYHDLYQLIKTADPTARVFAGTIVQPTPIRLQYLDMVLDSYQNMYGEPLPADGWSIHNFILNEVSCDYDPGNCWGAEIPPGINVPFGEVLSIEDNDNMELFKERIIRFRQWMVDRGYAGLPVSLSEYGILMPAWLGFDYARVNTFMNNTFNYMLTAKDVNLGDPNDDYRLIQKFSWYSTGAPSDPYNGYLFNTATKQLSPMGANYAAYTAQIPAQVDFYPVQIFSVPLNLSTSGNPANFMLKAQIANSGNLTQATGPVTVRFYHGNPANGGVQIGADQSVSLAGCGRNAVVEVEWPGVMPGSYQIYVVVDPEGETKEINKQNNVRVETIVVE